MALVARVMEPIVETRALIGSAVEQRWNALLDVIGTFRISQVTESALIEPSVRCCFVLLLFIAQVTIPIFSTRGD